MKKYALLEIGTEEIPARFIPRAMSLLKETAEKELKNGNVELGDIKAFGTPRRLAVIIDEIPENQRDVTREVFGPPKKAAYAHDGSLTKAALGFAASSGVSPENLIVKTKGKGEYVVAVVEEKGKAVKEILPEVFKKIVLSLHFPKSMRWGNGTLRFVRPIRWITALYANEAVEFEIDGIKSGNKTFGHRFLSINAIEIKDINEYERLLEKNYVIADPEKREKLIVRQAKGLAGKVGGTISVEVYDELLSTVTCLVEYPQAMIGSFDGKYLDLPDELIKSVLMGHQKYFPIKGGKGLSNSFVIVSNTKPENEDTVRVGAERVVRARLEDARFYFEEDKKKPLIDRLEDLKKVTYQEKLGSLYDKTMRVRMIAGELAKRLYPEGEPSTTKRHFPESGEATTCDVKALVLRAAELSKCDLITGVVREFPELQGIMGMYYTLGAEEDNVRFALRDHYCYEGYNGWSGVSAILALSDRIDNIVSFFSIGLVPTGSEDPFALRRQAIGVISILMEKEYGLPLQELVEIASKGKPDVPKKEVLKFFEQRVEPMLEATKQYPFDVIQAVKPYFTTISSKEVIRRLDEVKSSQPSPEYSDFLPAIKRVRNIVPPDRTSTPIDETLFKTPSETQLFSAYKDASTKINHALSSGDITTAINSAFSLTKPINTFFDETLVMDKDEAVRNNRLSLLQETTSVVWKIADFSKLQEAS